MATVGWVLCAVATVVALWSLLRAHRGGRGAQRFAALFAASGVPMLVVDQHGAIVESNPAADQLLAPDGGTLVGSAVEAIVPFRYRHDHEALQRSFWIEPTARAMAVGRVVAALRTDGVELPVEITLSPVTFDARDGRHRHRRDDPAVLVVLADLSGRDRTERELRMRSEELQRSNAALERFAWSASHDLQEPLRMIASYSQLLARRYADVLDDDGRQMVGFTVDGTVRMQRLISELLTYARASQGNKQHVVTDTRAQWDATVELLAAEIESTGADVALETELPAVVADPVEVRQLLQNLVGNALKYRGDAAPCVRAGCSGVERGLARFYVTDNGIGIEPRHQQKIFEPFQRLGTRASGTGLGLALCTTVVASHGGDIGVQSTPGAGATFWFTLPLAHPPADPLAHPLAHPPADPPAHPLARTDVP